MKRLFPALMLLLAAKLTAQTLPGLTITNNNFTYQAADGPVTGIIRLPAGSGPFPAVLISHGKGGTPGNFSLKHANILVGWGLACSRSMACWPLRAIRHRPWQLLPASP